MVIEYKTVVNNKKYNMIKSIPYKCAKIMYIVDNKEVLRNMEWIGLFLNLY